MWGTLRPLTSQAGTHRASIPPMRLLLDVLRPAHAHLFAALGRELVARGHDVRFFVRDENGTFEVLRERGLADRALVTPDGGFPLGFLGHSTRLWRLLRDFRPDAVTALLCPRTGVTPWLRRAVRQDRACLFLLRDDERALLGHAAVELLAHEVCTPDTYDAIVHGRQVTYAGFHALAYLHPKRFTPDVEVVRRLGVDPSSRYFVLRVLAAKRSRDYFRPGLTISQRIMLSRLLARFGRVYVSSDGPLPPELEALRLPCSGQDMLHLLAGAKLLVGESATMASEAAVLGVPAVYIAPAGRGYTDDLERRYDLVRTFNGPRFVADWMSEVRELAADEELPARSAAGRERLLREKIDVTGFLADRFERKLGAG